MIFFFFILEEIYEFLKLEFKVMDVVLNKYRFVDFIEFLGNEIN